jgi:hypothetical protein
MLDEIRKNTPEDAKMIDQLANSGVFFYDGPGVILPSGRRVTGEGMRALLAEAGYDPMAKNGDRNDPTSPIHWRFDV